MHCKCKHGRAPGEQVASREQLPPPPRAVSCSCAFTLRHQRGQPHTCTVTLTFRQLLEDEAAYRSHLCGTLRSEQAGEEIAICGWVDRYRNLGGLLFLDIRDHSGVLQVISDGSTPAVVLQRAEQLRQEWVVRISGRLRGRQDVNPRMATGDVELVLSDIQILNAVRRPLPFPMSQMEDQEVPRCVLHTRQLNNNAVVHSDRHEPYDADCTSR